MRTLRRLVCAVFKHRWRFVRACRGAGRRLFFERCARCGDTRWVDVERG